jgi:predicted AAA+ superfamily ATPase
MVDLDSSWFFLNFDDPRLYGFELEDFQRVKKLVEEGEYRYLFFDEIQLIDQWEGFIR